MFKAGKIVPITQVWLNKQPDLATAPGSKIRQSSWVEALSWLSMQRNDALTTYLLKEKSTATTSFLGIPTLS